MSSWSGGFEGASARYLNGELVEPFTTRSSKEAQAEGSLAIDLHCMEHMEGAQHASVQGFGVATAQNLVYHQRRNKAAVLGLWRG